MEFSCSCFTHKTRSEISDEGKEEQPVIFTFWQFSYQDQLSFDPGSLEIGKATQVNNERDKNDRQKSKIPRKDL